ncbi:helix-turn-helix domain-containing protein [Bradyrhizobium erythrophlei]|uniref:Transcriptional regulator, XRE family n=1 Tax=Bradyrhizobium erythrophlei TaxID=1437360 RepID=A0A1M7UKH7_9BRAD|nr:helix-turn-helix transcriptional regulator [Bradyrhizobium erythrophlei]SHN83415.1 transcriptional regulator, XRE family [Bradyrhizobium erythrophlei]
MKATASDIRTASPAGILLRQWRDVRGKTQLDLSFDAGVSQKHISFVESGRSIPSRQMLLDLAQALDVPLRERNELLVAAGYAPVYSGDALEAPVMNSIAKALQRMLRQHEPFPALVIDRHWNVVMTNEAAPALFNCFVDLAAWPQPRNLLHLMFDPRGLRPFVANWPETARGLLARVYREALGHVIDDKTKALLAALSQYPGVKAEWRAPSPGSVLPMIPLSLVKGGVTLNYFSLITTVGTPQTVTAEELRLECMFPADDKTETEHARFLKAHAARGPAH